MLHYVWVGSEFGIGTLFREQLVLVLLSTVGLDGWNVDCWFSSAWTWFTSLCQSVVLLPGEIDLVGDSGSW